MGNMLEECGEIAKYIQNFNPENLKNHLKGIGVTKKNIKN
jgi:hypothetical protein